MKKISTYVPYFGSIELVSFYAYEEFLKYYPFCELQTKRWFVENIRKDWHIFDIGANIGYYSILFSKLASEGKVFSFEPTDTFSMLNENLKYNDCRNVQTVRSAVGMKSGKYKDKVFQIWGKDPVEIDYNFITIDEFTEQNRTERLDCIKIDVDSYDFEVLRGAENTVERFNPWIVIELNHALAKRNQNVNAVLQWLKSKGYSRSFITDDENYILKRDDFHSEFFSLKFDCNPVLAPSQYVKSEFLKQFSAAEWGPSDPHIKRTLTEKYAEFSYQADQWNYISLLNLNGLPEASNLILEFDVLSSGHDIGIGVVKGDYKTYINNESVYTSSESPRTVSVQAQLENGLCFIVVRNTSPFSVNSVIRIGEIKAYASVINQNAEQETRQKFGNTLLHLSDLKKNIQPVIKEDQFRKIPDYAKETLGILNYSDLESYLKNVKYSFSLEKKLLSYGIEDFTMYEDDSRILEFFYRNIRPEKHLEFGTWEGFGALLAAKNSDAEIWTVNLEEGEFDSSGKSLYSNSDRSGNVGWMFKGTVYEKRIHQIYSDSTLMKKDMFKKGFFDTVLIDGGHSLEVVQNDTMLAAEWTKKGGYVFWHDFCADPGVMKSKASVYGVIHALLDHYKEWSEYFEDFCWIRPSWLMVARRK